MQYLESTGGVSRVGAYARGSKNEKALKVAENALKGGAERAPLKGADKTLKSSEKATALRAIAFELAAAGAIDAT
jgi:hypothetical protein